MILQKKFHGKFIYALLLFLFVFTSFSLSSKADGLDYPLDSVIYGTKTANAGTGNTTAVAKTDKFKIVIFGTASNQNTKELLASFSSTHYSDTSIVFAEYSGKTKDEVKEFAKSFAPIPKMDFCYGPRCVTAKEAFLKLNNPGTAEPYVFVLDSDNKIIKATSGKTKQADILPANLITSVNTKYGTLVASRSCDYDFSDSLLNNQGSSNLNLYKVIGTSYLYSTVEVYDTDNDKIVDLMSVSGNYALDLHTWFTTGGYSELWGYGLDIKTIVFEDGIYGIKRDAIGNLFENKKTDNVLVICPDSMYSDFMNAELSRVSIFKYKANLNSEVHKFCINYRKAFVDMNDVEHPYNVEGYKDEYSQPSPSPSADPSGIPVYPSGEPSGEPTATPVPSGSPLPTATTSPKPSEEPTIEPTSSPAPALIKYKNSIGEYTISGNTATFVKGSSKAKSVTINTVKYKGKSLKVTKIADTAFANCKNLTKAVIGDNVKTIGESAFFNCKKLSTVKIGKSVKTIGTSAFSGCVKLKKVTMGAKVETIGKKAFLNCKSLTAIEIPSSVKKIDTQAFGNCKNLKKIDVKSKKIKTIGKKAFSGVNSKAVTTVPKANYKTYKKLFKAADYKAKMKKK